jgi:hypothetical protein
MICHSLVGIHLSYFYTFSVRILLWTKNFKKYFIK